MERKLATVLFVDLVDSTGLVTGSDPEVVRRRVQRYFDQVSRCVTMHGGIVEKFAGDAVMAAFGIPQAHEDDAERAVRAALAIRDAVHELGLEARIGVESGQVVADDSDSTFATGEAVNVAARLEQAAEPGQLLIGPAAQRLTLGRVELEDVGPVELKGLDRQVWAWQVLGAGSAPARPASRRSPGTTARSPPGWRNGSPSTATPSCAITSMAARRCRCPGCAVSSRRRCGRCRCIRCTSARP